MNVVSPEIDLDAEHYQNSPLIDVQLPPRDELRAYPLNVVVDEAASTIAALAGTKSWRHVFYPQPDTNDMLAQQLTILLLKKVTELNNRQIADEFGYSRTSDLVQTAKAGKTLIATDALWAQRYRTAGHRLRTSLQAWETEQPEYIPPPVPAISESEQTLLQLIREGDEHAWRRLLAIHQNFIDLIVTSIDPLPKDAEEQAIEILYEHAMDVDLDSDIPFIESFAHRWSERLTPEIERKQTEKIAENLKLAIYYQQLCEFDSKVDIDKVQPRLGAEKIEECTTDALLYLDSRLDRLSNQPVAGYRELGNDYLYEAQSRARHEISLKFRSRVDRLTKTSAVGVQREELELHLAQLPQPIRRKVFAMILDQITPAIIENIRLGLKNS